MGHCGEKGYCGSVIAKSRKTFIIIQCRSIIVDLVDFLGYGVGVFFTRAFFSCCFLSILCVLLSCQCVACFCECYSTGYRKQGT